MPLITKSFFEASDLEVRKTAEGKPTIAGYAAEWNKLSVPMEKRGVTFREKLSKGSTKTAIESRTIKSLWNHNTDMPLGSTKNGTLRLSEDERGLKFELDPPDTQAGRDAVVSIERGDVDSMSFAFNTRSDNWDRSDPKNIVRTLIDVDLREVSPATFAAYETSLSVRSVEDDFADFSTEEEKRNQEAQADTNPTTTAALDILKLKSLTY